MGSVEPEKGGAAGSLEGTGYELGTGLGITVFGVSMASVLMASVFGRTIEIPSDLALPLAEQAGRRRTVLARVDQAPRVRPA
ncbi:hypothetical protein [Martelella limonii]|uniref:hypothetical protein n=1 Tax=Martelella limonii TaxID=1647649 RepID=UPI0019D64923|nr:hypothetical protein [Martelella limonii]